MPPGIAASAPDRAAAAPAGDTWVGVTAAPLDGDALTRWATTPDVGAVVVFHGTVRDHAPGRDGVTALTYEAYEEAAVARLGEVVDDVRRRWPDVRRVAAVHRTGRLEVGESAVVVVVAAPHRAAAFAAAAHGIDALKATVPLWKKETWAGGEEWGTDARQIEEMTLASGGPAQDGTGETMADATHDGPGGRAAAPEAPDVGASPSRRAQRASAGMAGATLGDHGHQAGGLGS